LGSIRGGNIEGDDTLLVAALVHRTGGEANSHLRAAKESLRLSTGTGDNMRGGALVATGRFFVACSIATCILTGYIIFSKAEDGDAFHMADVVQDFFIFR
jgi:hypothetical protein